MQCFSASDLGNITQLVEYPAFNRNVTGSNPVIPISPIYRKRGSFVDCSNHFSACRVDWGFKSVCGGGCPPGYVGVCVSGSPQQARNPNGANGQCLRYCDTKKNDRLNAQNFLGALGVGEERFRNKYNLSEWNVSMVSTCVEARRGWPPAFHSEITDQ